MKYHHLQFTPKAALRLTPTELKVLRLCSETHYDERCKDLTRKGFVTHLENYFKNTAKMKGAGCLPLDFGQIDTMTKCLEATQYINCLTPKEKDIGYALFWNLGTLLKHMNEATPAAIEAPLGEGWGK